MNFQSNEHERAYEASIDKMELQMEQAKARRFWEMVSLVLTGLMLVLFLYLLFESLIPDLTWCYENYAPGRIPHCYFYENSLWGRFIHPGGFNLPW